MSRSVRVVMVSTALLLAATNVAFAGDPEAPVSVAQAQNPCAVTNPCAAQNPCAAGSKVDPKLITRPKGTRLFAGERAELVKLGKELWNSPELSTKKGVACQTCHQGNAGFMASFAKPYPHRVAMPNQRAGLKRIQADEMVQFCMVCRWLQSPSHGNQKSWRR